MARPRPSRETIGERSRTHGHSIGYKLTPTYRSWSGMIQRCMNPKNPAFQVYGGAGISVCDRWIKFENFLADMGECPNGLTIDRYPDKAGNYEPGNCRWATRSEQALNRKTTRSVIRGDGALFYSLKEAAEAVNGNRRCIYDCCTGRQKSHLGQTYRYAT